MKINSIFKDNLTFLLGHTSQELRTQFADYLVQYDLVPPHKGIMTYLRENGSSNQLTLCTALSINKATMVRFIDHLEALGFVSRQDSEKDRREKFVTLSRSGKSILKKIEQKNWEIEDNYTKSLTPVEMKKLKSILLKLHQIED